MAQIDNPDDWLPIGEVITRTGLSQRTVYRMVSDGRLKQGQRRIPGRRPLSVFDPAEVAKNSTAFSKPRENQPVIDSQDTEALSCALLPPSELSFKLYLTEEEAVRYTGFGLAHLRAYGK